MRYGAQWEPNGPFGIVNSEDIKGGLHKIDWDDGVYATVSDALNALIPVDRRTEGMRVLVTHTGTSYKPEFVYTGSTWSRVKSDLEDNDFAKYGIGVLSGFSISQPDANTIRVNTGKCFNLQGLPVYKYTSQDIDLTGLTGIYLIYVSTTAGDVASTTLTIGLSATGDFPLAIVKVTAGVIDYYKNIALNCNGQTQLNTLCVGAGIGLTGGNFTTIANAMLWLQCFSDGSRLPHEISVIDDVTEPFSTHTDTDGINFCISTLDPYMAEAADRLDGLIIRGRTDGTTGYYPMVTFGTAAAKGYFAQFQGLQNMRVSGLIFRYHGSATIDPTDHNVTVFKNPGLGFRVDNVKVDRNDTDVELTHFCTWVTSSGNVELGGFDVNDSGNRTIFSNIRSHACVSKSIFYVNAAAGIDGCMSINDCAFVGWNTTAYENVVEAIAGSGSGGGMHIAATGLQMAGCSTTCFVLPSLAKFTITNSRYYASATTFTDISGSTIAMSTNCSYQATMVLGGSYYANCAQESGVTVTVNGAPSMVNCDFSNISNTSLVRPVGVRLLSALDFGRSVDTTRKSQIVSGCELTPTYIEPGLITDGAGYIIKPGVVAFPNGLVGYLPSQIYGVGYWDCDLDVAIETISGNSSWTPADGSTITNQFFYHFLRMKAGDTVPVGRFDLTPPDRFGRPASVGGTQYAAGYRVDDYAFIGTLAVFKVKNIGSLEAGFKGGAYVENFGGGLRKFGIANIHLAQASTDFLEQHTILGVAAGSTGTAIIFDDSTKTALAHVKSCQMTFTGVVYETGVSGGGDATFRCPGLCHHWVGFSMSQTFNFSACVDVPLFNGGDVLASLSGFTLGTYAAAFKLGMAMFTENVNNLYARGPAVAF